VRWRRDGCGAWRVAHARRGPLCNCRANNLSNQRAPDAVSPPPAAAAPPALRTAQSFISADAARAEAFLLEERRRSSDSGRSSDAGGDAGASGRSPPLPRTLTQQHAPQLRGALAQQHAYAAPPALLSAAAARPSALGFALSAAPRDFGPACAASLAPPLPPQLGGGQSLSLPALPPPPPPSAPHEHYRTRLCAPFVRAPRLLAAHRTRAPLLRTHMYLLCCGGAHCAPRAPRLTPLCPRAPLPPLRRMRPRCCPARARTARRASGRTG
jgi:hypothetical protein